MPTLTLKNVPPALHRRLKASAEAHRRSLNAEALTLLERALVLAPPDPEAERTLMARIASLHEGLTLRVTEEEVAASIREDRAQ